MFPQDKELISKIKYDEDTYLKGTERNGARESRVRASALLLLYKYINEVMRLKRTQ